MCRAMAIAAQTRAQKLMVEMAKRMCIGHKQNTKVSGFVQRIRRATNLTLHAAAGRMG
ncbi:MAG: hypothetical protein ABI072_02600 [Edaphobacter sp.]